MVIPSWFLQVVLPILLSSILAAPGLLAFFESRRSRRDGERNATRIGQVHEKVTEVEHTFNAKMDEAIRVLAEAQYAKGRLAGRQDALEDARKDYENLLIRRAIQAEGAADLLKAQRTPPARTDLAPLPLEDYSSTDGPV